MFSRDDSSSEVALEMEKLLVKTAMEKEAEQVDAGISKFASALDHLNAAAEIFDKLGLEKEAEYATKLLEVVAGKKKVRSPRK